MNFFHNGSRSADDVAGASFTREADPGAEEALKLVQGLPRELGVLLMTVGVVGFILPGPVGTPALLAGGLVLWPGAFSRVARWVERRSPGLYQQSMRQIGRFVNDLDKRYPGGDSTP